MTISSPTIEDSVYKTNNPETFGGDYHLRYAFGALVTDSVATYSDADNAHAWIGNATLTANITGFSALPGINHTWTSDFNPVAMVGVDMGQQSIPAGWFFGDGSSLPVTKNITVSVDAGVHYPAETNTYAITWHQPFEQWKDCQPAVAEEIDLIALSSQPTDIPGGQIAHPDQTFHCTFEFGPNQMADGIETAQKIPPVTQPFFSDRTRFCTRAGASENALAHPIAPP